MAADEICITTFGIMVVFTKYGRAVRDVWRANCEQYFIFCNNCCLIPILQCEPDVIYQLQ